MAEQVWRQSCKESTAVWRGVRRHVVARRACYDAGDPGSLSGTFFRVRASTRLRAAKESKKPLVFNFFGLAGCKTLEYKLLTLKRRGERLQPAKIRPTHVKNH